MVEAVGFEAETSWPWCGTHADPYQGYMTDRDSQKGMIGYFADWEGAQRPGCSNNHTC